MVDRQPWLKCAPDQTVKIRGKASLQVGIWLVHQCEFTVIGGDRPEAVTVAQLLKEAVADKDAARKKYNRKFVFLSGEFDSVTKSGAFRTVQLKGAGGFAVNSEVHESDARFLNSLKPGEAVTFLGQVLLNDRLLKLGSAILTRASTIPD